MSTGSNSLEYHNAEETHVHLELRIHATGLPRSRLRKRPSCWTQVDFLESSLPNSKQRKSWYQTEIVHNSCHPQWTKTLPLDYQYGKEVYFVVTVFSEQHEIIGGAIFEVSDILGTTTKARRLPNGGVLFCTLERTKPSQGASMFKCRFQASLKANKLQWGLDTYLEIAKKENTNSCSSWITIYRSPPVYGSTSPTFDPSLFFGIDWSTSLRISIWVYKQDKVIGTCETTWNYLLDAQMDRTTESDKDLILGKPGSNRTQVGKLRVVEAKTLSENDEEYSHSQVVSFDDGLDNDEIDDNATESMPPSWIGGGGNGTTTNGSAGSNSQKSFQEYINGGVQLDMVVAIDFTSSNGDPRHPHSLHYQDPDSLNDYEDVISTIGRELATYSVSQQFPVYGFGAKFDGQVRHIFQCGPTREVKGVDGILGAYQSMFKRDITMSGPTVLSEVIQAAAMRANTFHRDPLDSKYCVLLIITDGNVTDLHETKRKLGVYSKLPLSVIIACVGRTDFSGMNSLISDLPQLRSYLTLVTLRQHQADPTSLTKAAMEHLPEQIVEYFQNR